MYEEEEKEARASMVDLRRVSAARWTRNE